MACLRLAFAACAAPLSASTAWRGQAVTCRRPHAGAAARPRGARVRACAKPGPPPAPDGAADDVRNDGRATAGLFGLRIQTNGDVIKFGIAAIAAAYAFKTALQLCGVADLLAGQITTGFVSVASLIGWVSTYVFRVGTKGMTYAQQLRDYEDEVIKKRYEELSSEELAALSEELEQDK